VADRTLSREAHLDQLAQRALQWITRVPATVRAAPVALAHAAPPAMALRPEGDRAHAWTSPDGGVESRGGRIDSEARQPQAQRTVDTPLRQLTDQEVTAVKTVCRTTCACEAEARQALSAFAQDVQVTCLATSAGRATPRDDTRGRPGTGGQPAPGVYPRDGALAASRTPRPARIDQPGCVILATHDLDATPLTPPALLAGDTGQVPAERGCRLMKAPSVRAASRALNKPERSMALFMVRTVGWWVSAALDYRIRQALNDHEATLPDQQGHRMRHPTARWVWHEVVGMHWRCQPGQGPMVRNLPADHRPLLRLLGQPYMRLYDVRYS